MPLKILILESSDDRAQRISQELSSGAWLLDSSHARTCDEFARLLTSREWNAVVVAQSLCDDALMEVRRSGLDLPLFVISEDDAEEEALRDMMRRGARDVISASRLGRLIPSIERELRNDSSQSERSAIAHELAARERYHAAILENVREVILTLDADLTIRYANPWTGRVLQDGDSLVGRSLMSVCHRDDQDLLLDALEHETDVRVRLRGPKQWRIFVASFRHFASPLSGEHVVITARDLTDRIALETKLEQARRINSLGRLAATVAHEFNNVLMGVQPSIDLLRLEGHPGQEPAIARMERAVRRGRKISSEILRFANPAKPQLQPVDLVWHLEEYESEARELIGTRGTFELDIEPGTPPVLIDPEQLTQVLSNLVQNAADAIGPGGRIRVHAASLGDNTSDSLPVLPEPWRFVHLAVSDDGAGIPADQLPSIFEPLFTTKKTGTGLGLPVVHQIVSATGGSIHAVSHPGEGTTFHLLLPRALNALERKVDELTERAEARPSGIRRIVFVEDDELVAEGVVALLEEEGFEVTLVNLGEGAVAAIEQAPPDAVVLDLGLPDIPGDEVFRRIRARWPELPVVFSTGHGDREALLAPGDDSVRYLPKPWQVEELLRTLATLDLDR